MYDIIKALSLPPGDLLVLAGVGLVLLLSGWRRTGVVLVGAGVVALYLFSTPFMADILSAAVKPLPPLARNFPDDGAEAIVVLAAGFQPYAPEYASGSAVDELTLQRLAYAALLWRRYKLPILVSGGSSRDWPHAQSLAGLMKDMLENVFGVPVTWVEDKSADTYENAVFSADILRANNISRVLLVTHALHMPRAAQLFRLTGLNVIPAPTVFSPGSGGERFLPRQSAAQTSYYALYELLGSAWYRLNGKLTAPAP